MEIETTIKDLPKKVQFLNLAPDTPIKIIISESRKETEASIAKKRKGKASKYLFLNDDVWDGENTPSDLSTNVDKYLYDEE